MVADRTPLGLDVQESSHRLTARRYSAGNVGRTLEDAICIAVLAPKISIYASIAQCKGSTVLVTGNRTHDISWRYVLGTSRCRRRKWIIKRTTGNETHNTHQLEGSDFSLQLRYTGGRRYVPQSQVHRKIVAPSRTQTCYEFAPTAPIFRRRNAGRLTTMQRGLRS